MFRISSKILFVCYGNIARSQMAAAYYNKYTNSGNASSAGVSYDAGITHKYPTPDIVKIMLEDGVDISKSVVKGITKKMVDDADRIIIMCDLDDCPRYVLSSEKVKHVPTADPYSVSIEYARSVRDDIKRMVLGLIDNE
ncbi:MAG: low molecular weight phosphatase family protein [Candidatus Woesearchaeota archaeon]